MKLMSVENAKNAKHEALSVAKRKKSRDIIIGTNILIRRIETAIKRGKTDVTCYGYIHVFKEISAFFNSKGYKTSIVPRYEDYSGDCKSINVSWR